MTCFSLHAPAVRLTRSLPSDAHLVSGRVGEGGGQSDRFHGRLQLVRREEEVGHVDGLVAGCLNVKTK